MVILRPPQTSGSDANYVFTQGAAAATWTVNHNLGKYPSVQVFEDFGSGGVGEVIAHVEHVSVNQAIVRLNAAISGYAVCN